MFVALQRSEASRTALAVELASPRDPGYFVDLFYNARRKTWGWEIRKGVENNATLLSDYGYLPTTSGKAFTRRGALRKSRRSLRRYLKARGDDRGGGRVQIA